MSLSENQLLSAEKPPATVLGAGEAFDNEPENAPIAKVGKQIQPNVNGAPSWLKLSFPLLSHESPPSPRCQGNVTKLDQTQGPWRSHVDMVSKELGTPSIAVKREAP